MPDITAPPAPMPATATAFQIPSPPAYDAVNVGPGCASVYGEFQDANAEYEQAVAQTDDYVRGITQQNLMLAECFSYQEKLTQELRKQMQEADERADREADEAYERLEMWRNHVAEVQGDMAANVKRERGYSNCAVVDADGEEDPDAAVGTKSCGLFDGAVDCGTHDEKKLATQRMLYANAVIAEDVRMQRADLKRAQRQIKRMLADLDDLRLEVCRMGGRWVGQIDGRDGVMGTVMPAPIKLENQEMAMQ